MFKAIHGHVGDGLFILLALPHIISILKILSLLVVWNMLLFHLFFPPS